MEKGNYKPMKKLKEARKKAGVNQVELAKKIGKHDEAISAYERGTRVPSVYTLKAIAEVLKCELKDLI